ncbi:hypothetical protein HY229_08330 [Candidatus Acetothermia bacterium]|nr:hypothetical protein [Candidatus Acetothermia bacterium]MBI3644088.1 hypothetical protein [Candidatus Acetothermia bacterium]
MQGPDSGDRDLNPIFEELFSERLEPIRYDQHPSDDLLLSYLRGKLPKGWRSPDLYLQDAKSALGVTTWQQNEMTAHLITCIRCRQRVELLRENHSQPGGVVSWVENVLSGLRDQLNPVPRPALVTMAAQFAAIVGLGAWILFQPSALTSTASNLQGASSVSSSQMPTLPEPGPVVNSEELRSASTGNLQLRRSTVQSLMSNPDPRYLADTTHWLSVENDAEIRQKLMIAWQNQFNAIQAQINSAQRVVNRVKSEYQELGDFPSGSSDLEKLMTLADNLSDSFKLSQPDIFCTLMGSLSFSQIQNAAKDVDAKLIIDGVSPAGSFRLQLPATNSEQALQQLENELSMNCTNN